MIDSLIARFADLGPFDRVTVEESDALARAASAAVEPIAGWYRYALTLDANDPDDVGRGFAAYDAQFMLAIVQAWHVREGEVDRVARMTEQDRAGAEHQAEARRIEAERQRERELREQAAAALGAEIDQTTARLAELEAQRAAVVDGPGVEL